jgi:hypothetical protein
MTGGGRDDTFFRDEVRDTYRAAARLRVYAVWSAWVGVLLVVGVIGAMLIGWMDASDGFTWLGFALLTGIVAAARFYSDATRTTVNAASLERQLDAGEDLYAGTSDYRRRLRTVMLVGVAVLALGTAATAVYSVANVDTRTTHDDDDDDNGDDDDDGDDDDGDDRDDDGNERDDVEEPDDGGQPAGDSGGGGSGDDDGEGDDD